MSASAESFDPSPAPAHARALALGTALLVPLAIAAVVALRGGHSATPPPPTAVVPSIPPPRGDPAVGWDPVHGRLVVYAGFGVSAAARGDFLADTWTWDGHRWMRAGGPSPGRRVGPVMVWDVAGTRMLLTGGYSPGGAGPLADTWSWEGSHWSLLTTRVDPVSVLLPVMVSEGRGDSVLLITRDAPAVSLTWRWTGVSWSVVSRHSPPLNSAAVAAATGAGGTVVFVDFSGAAAGDAGETWTWDGRAWSAHPGAGPAVFDPLTAVMAGDPATGQVVLFQTVGPPGSAPGQTWTWDGQRWTKRPPSGPATAVGMVTNTNDGHAMLVGGPKRGDVTQVWEWRSGRWQRSS